MLWLVGKYPRDDRPCKETGDDRDLDVILTQVSPGVRSWPYPDNQEGLNPQPPLLRQRWICEQLLCVHVCLLSSSGLLIYWLVILAPPSWCLSRLQHWGHPLNPRTFVDLMHSSSRLILSHVSFSRTSLGLNLIERSYCIPLTHSSSTVLKVTVFHYTGYVREQWWDAASFTSSWILGLWHDVWG